MGSFLIFPWTSFSTLANSGITSQQNRLVLNFDVNSGNELFISNHDISGILLQEDDNPVDSSFNSPARGFRFYSRVGNRQAPLAEIMTLTGAGNLGLGTTAPATKLHVSGTGVIRARVNSDSNAGLELTLNNQPGWSVATANGGQFLVFNDAISQSAFSIDAVSNALTINSLGSAGSTQLCRNASNQIATCSPSARYKNNINSFRSGLSLIRELRPVLFNWKDGGMQDMELVAEEIKQIEPLLTTTNSAGQVEGVKYDRVSVVLINNAVKEQQTQIEELTRQNQAQQSQLAAMMKLLCTSHRHDAVCKCPLQD